MYGTQKMRKAYSDGCESLAMCPLWRTRCDDNIKIDLTNVGYEVIELMKIGFTEKMFDCVIKF